MVALYLPGHRIGITTQVPAQLGPTKTALCKVPRSNPIDHGHVDFGNIDLTTPPPRPSCL